MANPRCKRPGCLLGLRFTRFSLPSFHQPIHGVFKEQDIMPITDPGQIAKLVTELDKHAQTWCEKAATLDKFYQKKWSEYGTINSALWEGHKEIEKQSSELQDARVTFAKMTVKVDGLRTELTTTGKLARDMKAELQKSLPKLESALKEVEKLLPLNKGSSVLKDAKTECEARIKKIGKLVNTLESDAQDCEEPPKTPTLPALPK
jgi:hypothetical protein